MGANNNLLNETKWKQAGAELCQAQEKLGLAKLALPLRNCGRLPFKTTKKYGPLPFAEN